MQTGCMKTPKATPQKKPLAQVIEQAMATVTELPWFEGFHAGKHTDRHGKEFEFTRADLQQVVDNFEPNTIPFVTGHPEADAPAYGFAKEIKISDDDKLYLNGDGVDEGFAKTVVKGFYGKRSLGLQFNKAKGWHLDHVAFLGAVKPALKLQPVGQYNFTAEHEQPIQFDFSIEVQTGRTLVRLMRSIREFFLQNDDEETANKIVDKWDAEWLNDELIRQEMLERDSLHDHLSPAHFSTNSPVEDDMSKFTQEQLDTAVAQGVKLALDKHSAEFSTQSTADKNRIAELEKEKKTMQFSQQVQEHQSWINAQVSAGKLLPAQAIGMAEFMAHIGAAVDDEAGKFEFSRGKDDKVETVQQSPVEFMKAMVENGGKHSLLDDDKLDEGAPVGDDADAILKQGMQYQKSQEEAGNVVTIEDAIAHVSGEQS